MITVRITGGLGNQMFQYAAGRRLALKNDVELKLDLRWYAEHPVIDTHRSFDLSALSIQAGVATEHDLDIATGIGARLRRKLFHLYHPATNLMSHGSDFNASIMNAPDGTRLDGNLQNEKYFVDVREQIIADFSPKDTPSPRNRKLIQLASGPSTVSLHVRRGDYISNANANTYHGILSPEYYLAAMRLVEKSVKAPHYLVFSDDIEWCRDNIHTPHPIEYIDHNVGKEAYWDLTIMSHCRHNIIANSSFSWWGGWLNSNTDKTVIAPKKWFVEPSANSAGLIPGSWIQL